MVKIPLKYVCIVCEVQEDGHLYSSPRLNINDDSNTLIDFPGVENWDVSVQGPSNWVLDCYMQAHCPEHAKIIPEADQLVIFCDEFPAEVEQTEKGSPSKLKLVLDTDGSNKGS